MNPYQIGIIIDYRNIDFGAACVITQIRFSMQPFVITTFVSEKVFKRYSFFIRDSFPSSRYSYNMGSIVINTLRL